MIVSVTKEAGLGQALFGLSLSFNSRKPYKDLYDLAKRLAPRDGGHNKFLESICVWMYIRAPLYWWKQFDTYRVGVTKQSESTMHTILRHELTNDDFEFDVPNLTLYRLNAFRKSKNFTQLINELPDGYLQARCVCLNYKVLRHIFLQRNRHKLPEWRMFIVKTYYQLKHPELLGIKRKEAAK